MLVNDFAPQAKAIRGGDPPYRDQRIEYPPLSVPVLIAPIYLGDGAEDFVDGFQWEMLVFDLGIVVLIALGLPGDPKRVVSALGVYTVGVVRLSDPLWGRARSLADRHGAPDPGSLRPRAGPAGPRGGPGPRPGPVGDLVAAALAGRRGEARSRRSFTLPCFAASGGSAGSPRLARFP